MKKTIVSTLLLLATTVLLLSYDLPKGWHPAGSNPEKYDMGIDKGAGMNGKNVATIKSNSKVKKGFGTLMQTSLPDKYLGKKVRMSGYMKSVNVTGWAGFWFRVDKAGTTTPLAFDNMYDRKVTGTTDWKKYEIVLEVDKNAQKIAFGALLGGEGQIWFDNISFDIVEDATPTTTSALPSQPQNLNFEQ